MTDETEQEIKEKNLTAPRVTPESIEALISAEYYIVTGEALRNLGNPVNAALMTHTICVLVLKNGYIVIGESACASPENFDESIGRKTARRNAVNKIWPLEGYLLRTRLHEGW
jgi:hypothetical protein